MQCKIIKEHDYVIVDHHSPVLNRPELEFGYSRLMDSVLRSTYDTAICNFSSILSIQLNPYDVTEIIHALSLIFAEKPYFHFIVVAPTEATRKLATQVENELIDILDHPDFYATDTIAEARQIAERMHGTPQQRANS